MLVTVLSQIFVKVWFTNCLDIKVCYFNSLHCVLWSCQCVALLCIALLRFTLWSFKSAIIPGYILCHGSHKKTVILSFSLRSFTFAVLTCYTLCYGPKICCYIKLYIKIIQVCCRNWFSSLLRSHKYAVILRYTFWPFEFAVLTDYTFCHGYANVLMYYAL